MYLPRLEFLLASAEMCLNFWKVRLNYALFLES